MTMTPGSNVGLAALRALPFALTACTFPGVLGDSPLDSNSSGDTTAPVSATDPTGAPTTGAAPTTAATEASTTGTTGDAIDPGETTSTGPVPDTGDTSADTVAADTSASTTSTGDSSTGDSSTGDSSTGAPTEEPKSCLAADLPYAGPLCGGPGPACVIERDEVPHGTLSERVNEPALALDQACQPRILYDARESEPEGHYVERGPDGTWTHELFPAPLERAGLVIDPADGVPTAVVEDDAHGLALFRRVGGVWDDIAAIPGPRTIRTRSVTRDGQGRVWSAAYDDAKKLRLELFDGAWKSSLQGGVTLAGLPFIAISPVDDRRHLLTWRTVGEEQFAEWQIAGEPAELITTASKKLFGFGTAVGAVVPSLDAEVPDVPFVLLSRGKPTGGQELMLAHRPKPGQWVVEHVAEELPGLDVTCNNIVPKVAGEQCFDHHRRFTPEAVLTSVGGDVRFLWMRNDWDTELLAVCEPDCQWQIVGGGGPSGELFIGWRGDDGPESSSLAELHGGGFDVELDSTGDIHVAYWGGPGVNVSQLRYLRIGM